MSTDSQMGAHILWPASLGATAARLARDFAAQTPSHPSRIAARNVLLLPRYRAITNKHIDYYIVAISASLLAGSIGLWKNYDFGGAWSSSLRN